VHPYVHNDNFTETNCTAYNTWLDRTCRLHNYLLQNSSSFMYPESSYTLKAGTHYPYVLTACTYGWCVQDARLCRPQCYTGIHLIDF